MERYEKLRVIGQGAFGKVFLVRRKSDNAHVVIKQIPVDDLQTEERVATTNEVTVLRMLKHPNIVAHYGNFVHERSLMIVMEYAPGGTLHDFLQERKGSLIPEKRVLQLFVQLLVAIEHVHSRNILHRDLKTQNVLMNKQRTVLKIGDFGISKVLSSKITSADSVVGTPCYISPEICKGEQYAKKSDVWALGCILYEMTTLRKAFIGPNLPALVLKIMKANSVLEPIDSRYSRQLSDLIHSMLQLLPAERPNINNVMAMPIVVNAHMNLCTEIGRIPCTRSTQEASTRGSASIDGGGGVISTSTSSLSSHDGPTLGGPVDLDPTFQEEDHHHVSADLEGAEPMMPAAAPLVYTWGGCTSLPIKLDPPIKETNEDVVGVACGRNQRAGVTKDGKLFFWKLSSGSMATATTHMTAMNVGGRRKEPLVFEPELIGGLNSMSIRKVACGDMFTACLSDKGILLTFGGGQNGCLGHSDHSEVKEPKIVQAMLEQETTEVACGPHHVVAITSDGLVFAWGKGDRGQLGIGDHKSYATPRKVKLPADHTPSSVSCGPDCSIIITSSGKLLASGYNKYNKLTLDVDSTQASSNDDEKENSEDKTAQELESQLSPTSRAPKLSSLPPSSHVPSLEGNIIPSSDKGDTPAILSLMKDSPNVMTSSVILSNLHTRRMSAKAEGGGLLGSSFTATKGGSLRGGEVGGASSASSSILQLTGRRQSHQSVGLKVKGMVEEVMEFTPSGSELVRSKVITAASMGTNHTALLTSSGECITCGDNRHGQLGYRRGERESGMVVEQGRERQPAIVPGLAGKDVERVACGDLFTIACCKGGDLYSWGRGGRGRLGRETEEDSFEPRPIPFEHAHSVVDLDCSQGVSVLLTLPTNS